jgi:iron(II)-dependent oxidoreductase
MDLDVARSLSREQIAELLTEARERTLRLVAPLPDEDLLVQHDPLMSPIVWDLGHIGHFEEVWLLENVARPALAGLGGAPTPSEAFPADSGPSAARPRGDSPSKRSEGLRGIFNPFENPRSTRGALPLPTPREARDYLARVRAEVLTSLPALDLEADSGLLEAGFVFRMVLQHEYQHGETILQTLQLKKGAPYPAPRSEGGAPSPAAHAPKPGTMVRFPGGVVEQGTDDRSAAYDNERPRHEVRLEPFWMDVHPVTNGEYLEFVEKGGYDEASVWSRAGWAWRTEANLSAPLYWTRGPEGWAERFMDRVEPLDPRRPVCHVCYWEADAFARWAGKRLPTESEWEAAASWDGASAVKRAYPWGDGPPTPERANLDALLFETVPVGTYPQGVSAIGCWGMLGNVWEWTSSDFAPYPGYETYPYPEYSEVFFDGKYKVLRGGGWGTRPGAIRNTFRNWDYPIRRQIFSGLRCARDD